MSSSEFVDWQVYLDEEPNRFQKEDFYLAALTAEVRRSWVRHPSQVDMRKFLLNFKVQEEREDTPEQFMKKSKAFWGIALSFPKKLKDK